MQNRHPTRRAETDDLDPAIKRIVDAIAITLAAEHHAAEVGQDLSPSKDLVSNTAFQDPICNEARRDLRSIFIGPPVR